jgi:membrane-bound lytic murein transglycosylase B
VKVSKEVAATIATTVARRDGSCQATRDMSVALPLSEWQHLGVRTTAGGSLPALSLNASLVSGNSRHFLTYQNYDALLQYNCAHAYALSVALLADQIAAAPAPRRPAPAQPARAPAARRTIAK